MDVLQRGIKNVHNFLKLKHDSNEVEGFGGPRPLLVYPGSACSQSFTLGRLVGCGKVLNT